MTEYNKITHDCDLDCDLDLDGDFDRDLMDIFIEGYEKPKYGSLADYVIIKNGNGVYYSEVDMNLNGGLGAITLNKNILLFSDSDEKIAVTTHANGIDFWVIGRVEYTNTYHSHLLTSSGINMTPITTNKNNVTNCKISL